jgi:hypothetical protein
MLLRWAMFASFNRHSLLLTVLWLVLPHLHAAAWTNLMSSVGLFVRPARPFPWAPLSFPFPGRAILSV